MGRILYLAMPVLNPEMVLLWCFSERNSCSRSFWQRRGPLASLGMFWGWWLCPLWPPAIRHCPSLCSDEHLGCSPCLGWGSQHNWASRKHKSHFKYLFLAIIARRAVKLTIFIPEKGYCWVVETHGSMMGRAWFLWNSWRFPLISASVDSVTKHFKHFHHKLFLSLRFDMKNFWSDFTMLKTMKGRSKLIRFWFTKAVLCFLC